MSRMCYNTLPCCSSTEFDDVRSSLARRKTNGRYIPLKLYRSSRNNSISVTDVQSGLWCEVQIEYRYLHPLMKKTPEWSKMEERGKPVQLKTTEMKKGTSIHLAKGRLALSHALVCCLLKCTCTCTLYM